MTVHPLVEQLRFTRGEWLRAFTGVPPPDALRHFGPMNSISWIVGHLAWQEQRYFLARPQGLMPRPDVQERFTTGAPMSTPPLAETRKAWREITRAADPFLDEIDTRRLMRDLPNMDGTRTGQTLGSALRRLTYHYWFHIGEILAIRQMLGHKRLPQYVGAIEQKAPYRAERR
jgi:uncharacterized damage-inducible protein DinB